MRVTSTTEEPTKTEGTFFGRTMTRMDMLSHGMLTPEVPRTWCTTVSSISQSIPTSRQRVTYVWTPAVRSTFKRRAVRCIVSSYQYAMCTS